jgi:DNA mismatch repair protein MSH4
MRLRYEAPEGTMMIDIQTIHSLELIQNLQNAKSRDCLFGLLNHTLTPMGARLLRSNILQPSTSKNVLNKRYGALQDFVTHEELFFGVRQGMPQHLTSSIMANLHSAEVFLRRGQSLD